MKIGTIIRKQRKKLGMTQEEMANRLGITTPAVNKWENDNTLPDITLLAPIARLLGITTDELLSFKEDLTTEEIHNFILQLKKDLREKDFETVFLLAKSKIEEYPNCGMLILYIANTLDLWSVMNKINIPNKEYYDDIILKWYERCLKSDDAQIRGVASQALFDKYYYIEQDYEMALKYAKDVYCENTQSKFMEALVYGKTNKKDEAYKILEELLLKRYTEIQTILSHLCEFYMEDNSEPSLSLCRMLPTCPIGQISLLGDRLPLHNTALNSENS